jgi:hypothetical protein
MSLRSLFLKEPDLDFSFDHMLDAIRNMRITEDTAVLTGFAVFLIISAVPVGILVSLATGHYHLFLLVWLIVNTPLWLGSCFLVYDGFNHRELYNNRRGL